MLWQLIFCSFSPEYTIKATPLFDIICLLLKLYGMKTQPCIRNNFNLNLLNDLWKLDERFSAEWAGAPCLYNVCEKLVWMVHFYGAVLLVVSLQKQFSPKPPSVLQTRAYAISLSLKVNWFITLENCIDWKERSTAAMWQWFARYLDKDNSCYYGLQRTQVVV